MLRGLIQNLVLTRTQEKGAVTPQETEPDLPVSVQMPPADAWVDSDIPWGHQRVGHDLVTKQQQSQSLP